MTERTPGEAIVQYVVRSLRQLAEQTQDPSLAAEATRLLTELAAYREAHAAEQEDA